ncbi:hypothetical protein F4553_001579 [Allocatelliglobosispora scoriae]|uniref:Uncharacterized protein n=1 Tax=Allocatelliglobosispora scoriae TaxID=643052 RepID=A0A841BN03_9ACTN|nr:hypothetical protein [Allocatelliglobosispora scoriae]MBB5868200.1 hypothetical protein [Allocatelliglobosispora scoriae]
MTPEEWLDGEMRHHLEEFGQIGLYELLWLLNETELGLSDEAAMGLARRVATTGVTERLGELRRLSWVSADVLAGPLDPAVLADDEAWLEDADSSYVALVQP